MRTLGDVIKIDTGEQLNKSDMLPEAEHPVINGGIDFSGYTDKYNCEANTITISQGGASAGYVNWLDQQFWAGAHCYVVTPLPDNDIRFLYHFIKSREYNFMKNQQGAGIPCLNRSEVYKTAFPNFDYNKQKEIARILDTFTSMITNLETELASRKKQYEYYRNKLLTFDENDKSVEWKLLGEIATFRYGFTDKGNDFGSARYIRITDITEDGCLQKVDAKYIDITNDSQSYILKKGDVLMARTGATYGKTLFFEEEYPSIYASFLIKIDLNESILNRFYWFFSKSHNYWKQANKLVGGGAQPQFNANVLSSVKVPIPSLQHQQEIVSILDTFESLITNLKKEIEARKKQYEYYREQLLTFE